MASRLKFRALILDVDGTMTDGGLYLDDHNVQTKRFDVSDGTGIKYYQRLGGLVGFLTGRASQVVAHRAAELDVRFVLQKALDKADGLRRICRQMGVSPADAAYMGDDLPDLPAMALAGYSLAPSNAAGLVKARVDHVTQSSGGHGAVREAVEHLLMRSGLWTTILERYAK